ncbi:hypothetical protein ACVNP3_07130 [Pseudomonas chlororaphis subsp. piscium]
MLIVHNVETGQETQLALKADGNAEIKSQFTVKVIDKDIELNASSSITLNAQQMNVNVSQTNWTGNYSMIGSPASMVFYLIHTSTLVLHRVLESLALLLAKIR